MAPYVGAVRRLSEGSRGDQDEQRAAQAAFHREPSVRFAPLGVAALGGLALALGLLPHASGGSVLLKGFLLVFTGWCVLGLVVVGVLRVLAAREDRRRPGDRRE